MTKHTQGPWFTGYNDPKVVYPENGHVKDHALHPLATVHDFDGEAEANARLIASAPELLAALEEVVAEWDYQHADEDHRTGITSETAGIIFAREAIAKAKE